MPRAGARRRNPRRAAGWDTWRMGRVHALARFAATAVAIVVAARSSAAPPSDGAFGGFVAVPADVRLAVRVRDARALRADARLAPLRDALQALLGSRTLSESWDRLAAQLGTDASSLGDQLLGLDVVYAERASAAAAEWAIVTRVDPRVHQLLVDRLKPAAGSGGRAAFAEHRAVAAWRPPYLVVGPVDRAGLLDDVVRAFDAPGDAGTVAALAPVAVLRDGPAAPIEVVWRQDPGSVAAMQARTGDRGVEVQFRGSGAAWPLRVAGSWPVDPSWCAALARGAAFASVGNAWNGPADAAGPVDRLLAEGVVDEAMRANRGARTAVVAFVGGRGEDPAIPQAAAAIEVRDARLAWHQWRAWAARLAARLAARAGVPVPEVREAGGPRAGIDLRAVLSKVFGGHPLAACGAVGLEVLPSGGRAWVIVSAGADAHERMRASLLEATVAAPGAVHECGEASGAAISGMLSAWAADAARFAPDASTEFADGASMAARLAAAVARARWRMHRIDDSTVEGSCVIEVARP